MWPKRSCESRLGCFTQLPAEAIRFVILPSCFCVREIDLSYSSGDGGNEGPTPCAVAEHSPGIGVSVNE